MYQYPYNQNGNYPYQNGVNPYQQQQYNEYMRRQLEINRLRRKEISELIVNGVVIGAAILAFLLVQSVIVVAFQKSSLYSLYEESGIFQNAFNIITVHVLSLGVPFSIMALILKNRFIGPLIPTKKLGAAKMSAWVALGLGASLCANIITNYVIRFVEVLGYELSQPELKKPDSVLAIVVSFFAIALVPGIFEEYALRCCTLGVLKKYGKGFAVVAVSIVFGLIHGNIIQFIFAFMVGLVLGYITIVTDNVIPAMIIHAGNNSLSVINDAVLYFSGKQIATYVTGAITIAIAVCAVISLIYLLVKKEFLPKMNNGENKPYEVSLGIKFLCLLPGFALPFGMLIYLTTFYIKHK